MIALNKIIVTGDCGTCPPPSLKVFVDISDSIIPFAVPSTATDAGHSVYCDIIAAGHLGRWQLSLKIALLAPPHELNCKRSFTKIAVP